MSKIELAKIKSLTFYNDAVTAARRTAPMPQLVCVGKPCRVFQPEAVRCVNLGGSGTDVDWKCEADLPDSLRFGKVEVSCEGWSKPGDPYVLKGSCSLEYRLVEVPRTLLRDSDSPLFNPSSYDWASIFFFILWLAFLGIILYSFILSCFRNNTTTRGPRPTGHNRPGGGGSSGWFPGGYNDHSTDPPPPYSKNAQPEPRQGWRPGFFTGALVGGLANHLWNRPRNEQYARTTSYDWERRRAVPRSSFFGGGSTFRQPSYQSDDRGEGSSNLGSMRRSTGLGGTNVR
uniref:Store-operated calcium entry-associated regulatory factor n=1 Tax=Psilocybe cubensis TaxID=181762 RepID=A0A8H7Y2W1_PSICU